jgi:hypothetical protein
MELFDTGPSLAGAAVLREQASRIHAAAMQARSAASACAWSSPAAGVFAGRLEHLLALTRLAEQHLDSAAGALQHHGRSAHERSQVLAAVGSAVSGLLS